MEDPINECVMGKKKGGAKRLAPREKHLKPIFIS